MDRRAYLTGIATTAALGLAGCGGSGDTSAPERRSPTARSTSSTTPTETSKPTPEPTPEPTATPGRLEGERYTAEYVRENAHTDVDYDDLFRDFEQYQGEAIHYNYGLLYQAMYDRYEDYDYHQLNVKNDPTEAYQGDVAMIWAGDERLLEDDLIELWAIVENLYEYETVQGETRTIPLLTLVDYELREEE